MTGDGFHLFAHDVNVQQWADAALLASHGVDLGPDRHANTWAVGLDALPNGPDGSVAGVPLDGPWRDLIDAPPVWHRAQISTVYHGYPGKDVGESEAAHRFRLRRDAAHVDGLLPEGPQRRRYLKEPHAFILGVPLTDATASPLVVWPGSHEILGAAFEQALRPHPPKDWSRIDLTDVYQAARARVFDDCPRVAVPMQMGQSVLLHRHLLHGVAPWADAAPMPQGRRVAYFRPESDVADWLR